MNIKFQKALDKIYGCEKTKIIRYKKLARTSHEIFFVDFYNELRQQETLVFKIFPKNIPEYKNPKLGKEVRVMKIMADIGVVGIPKILFYANSKKLFGRDFFVMEKIDGTSMSELISKANSEKEKKEYVKQVARLMVKIHNTNIKYFSFLDKKDYALVVIENNQRLLDSLRRKSNILNPRNLKLMQKIINFLKKEKPSKTDYALLNGDFGPGHFIRTSDNNYKVLDWDPAEIGDRSWDIYWMIKEVPSFIFGYENALEDLLSEYELMLGRSLLNKVFYSHAALVWAYVLGWYIEERTPDNLMVPAIRKYRPFFERKLETMLKS